MSIGGISRDTGHPVERRGDSFAETLRAWNERGRTRPIVMGVINVTPDSFSDGGAFFERDQAVEQGRRLLTEGAEILDIGGESTRAQAAPVQPDDENRRVLPVIEALAGSGALLSIDTMKAGVADAALRAGAHIVNDVRGLQGDPELAEVAAAHGAGLVIMHNPGLLGSASPLPGDPIRACLAFFERSLAFAARAGVQEDRIVLDPGFGFGKSVEQNYEILARLPELDALGLPILVGASRKMFIGKVTGRDVGERLIGTLAANVAAGLAGAAILRVHDVAAHVEAMNVVAAIRAARGEIKA